NQYHTKKQVTFALDNNNRKGRSRPLLVLLDRRDERGFDCCPRWKEHSDMDRNGEMIFVKTRIHLTKVTGVRTNLDFDFTAPGLLSDTTLIVE
ncbi:hypothetical protein PMAYCL1PPCAC_14590, partial [Pristionchus mayeri]